MIGHGMTMGLCSQKLPPWHGNVPRNDHGIIEKRLD
ncbi:hypothetical protein Ocin01_18095 [Orchesella cincta]|uniref:Uncharacterized protein n=1 Tax=Orchesella cincta TaxID=48709 RepID=A0A1D2M6H8_ORCCI|nr:hypothetical protein Ocin01_18095 [Orchesella cincta]